MHNHIILIGFKNVGKSVIGKELAMRLQKNFIDLDQQIEKQFEKDNHKKLLCRQIMVQYGEDYFRNLENNVLQNLLSLPPSIISLGGGSLINEVNQSLIQGNLIVHIVAPKAITFERIMMHGRPAFFSEEESPLETFHKLWDEREKVYKKLAHATIFNNGSIDEAVTQIIQLRGKSHE